MKSSSKKDTMVILRNKLADNARKSSALNAERQELERQLAQLGDFLREGEFALVTFKAIEPDEEAETSPMVLFNAPGTGMVCLNAYVDIEPSMMGFALLKDDINAKLSRENIHVRAIKKINKKDALEHL